MRDPTNMPPAPEARQDVTRATWEALGTRVDMLVTDPAGVGEATSAVRELLARVDKAYSRFRPDSELVALNEAGGQRVAVSPLLLLAIQRALEAARATDGAVDPTIGGALRLLGYDRDFAALPLDGPAPNIRIGRVAGWRSVEVDAATRTVRLPAGVSLDLGSTGKALAADLAAEAANERVGGGVLVSLGGDVSTAGDAPGGGWRVLCSEDSSTDPASGGEVVSISSGGLATSTVTVRRWTAGGIERHHIVDPATGLPADGPWRSATVAAATCVDANAAATAAIVLGERAAPWLERLGLPARLTDREGRVTRVASWPEPASTP